jgi:hypothetical protein
MGCQWCSNRGVGFSPLQLRQCNLVNWTPFKSVTAGMLWNAIFEPIFICVVNSFCILLISFHCMLLHFEIIPLWYCSGQQFYRSLFLHKYGLHAIYGLLRKIFKTMMIEHRDISWFLIKVGLQYVNNTGAFTTCRIRYRLPKRNIWLWWFYRYRTCFRSQMIQNISFQNILEYSDHYLFGYKKARLHYELGWGNIIDIDTNHCLVCIQCG